jgi:SMI1 / KNR4 family protein
VGIPKEQYLSFFIDDLNEEVILGTMLGISENKNFSLTDWNSEYQMELPYDSFVFGTECGGGLFVMIVSGEDRGIYFWDHTFIFDQSSVDSNVYFLADNFTNFIEKLYISEP